MNAMGMDWSCKKKLEARDLTIIVPAMDFFGGPLPGEKQYWTVCGKCFKDDGSPLEGCEAHQVISSGLIKPSQFHGVDVDERVIKGNELAWPGMKWILGDFHETLLRHRPFDPGIVNCDLPFKPVKATVMVGDVMYLLDDRSSGPLMLVVNMTIGDRFTEEYDMLGHFYSNEKVQHLLQHGSWELYKDSVFKYKGSYRNDNTTMGSIVLFRNFSGKEEDHDQEIGVEGLGDASTQRTQ